MDVILLRWTLYSSVHTYFLGFWFLGSFVSVSFRTGSKRGIVNYPFGFEDCAEERTSYLFGVIFVTCKLGVSGAEQLKSCSESPLLHDCSASGFWFWFGFFCFGETRRTEGGVKCMHRMHHSFVTSLCQPIVRLFRSFKRRILSARKSLNSFSTSPLLMLWLKVLRLTVVELSSVFSTTRKVWSLACLVS